MTRDLSDIHAIAFDLDGTLVDSAPDVAHALNAALAEAGLQSFDPATVRGWIGGGPDLLIRRALEAQGLDPDVSDLHARLRRRFDWTTLGAPLSHGAVFDGIVELVSNLYPMLPLVVVTNKPPELARAVLEAAKLLQFMSAVHGAGTPEQLKPSPALLLGASQRLAVAPAELLMVGDSAADVQSAQAAGCPAALVAWGYGGHAIPTGSTPWRIDTPPDLLAAIAACCEEHTND